MKNEILKYIDNPRELEQLYRKNKAIFKRDFNLIFPELKEQKIAQVWHERLNYESNEISWGTANELIFILAISVVAGILAKLPEFIPIKSEFYYSRNSAFIVFPLLSFYFAWRQKNDFKKVIILTLLMLVSLVYINLLPHNSKSDTLFLACIHLPLFLWAILGLSFVGDGYKDYQKRLDYLRYNGDLVVITTLILIAGIVLTAITFGLFSLINVHIENFYLQYVVVWGLAASPLVGTYLIQTNPQLVNKVSPVIAKVFTPLVLLTLGVYLIAIIYTGKDPYNDRDFLLVFNILLIGVMSIILFSIAETSKSSNSKIGILMLFALSLITILVNGIALSAIVFRISEWGITPNRLAVLGGNILILANLIFVAYRLFASLEDKNELAKVESSIVVFLPIYSLWTVIVTFIFPVMFGFR
jgi:hypothetical protein